MERIKVCAYCRVSTNARDQENSFENQNSYFKRVLGEEENFKYELVNIYADKGLSGTSFHKRESFLNMLYDAGIDHDYVKGKIVFTQSNREPLFNRIFVTNASRFARNILSFDIIRELKNKKVYIEFLDTGFNTETADEMNIVIFLTMAQNESIDKSRKVRFGLKESANKGAIFTNGKIYGYKYYPENNSLEIIEEEATVVRLVFDLYIKGLGIRRIINMLNEKGYKTRNKKEFSPSMIKRMLTQEKYCGDLVRNKYDTGVVFNKNSYAKIRPKDEWIIHRNVVPAIISRECFEKAQSIRDSKESSTGQRGVYKGISEYAGFIFCEKCGQPYIRNIDKGRIFYNCSTKKTKGTKACDNVNVQLCEIEMHIETLQRGGLHEIFLYDRDAKILRLQQMKERILMDIDRQATEVVEKKQKRLSELQEEKSRLARLYLKGTFSDEDLDELSLILDKETQEVQAEIRQASKSNEEIYSEAKEIDQTVEQLKRLEIKPHYSKEELMETLKSFTVSRDPEDMRRPFLTLEFKVFDLINRLVDKYPEEIHNTATADLVRIDVSNHYRTVHQE